MRLIDVRTFQLCEFQRPDDNLPYAILSHTWGDDEVTFQEFCKETGREGFSKEALKENARYSKILQCCAKAEHQGFRYVWIDTCCIDKTSSNELSEAINSMYKWYSQATVCYVYLSNVKLDGGDFDTHLLGRSRWFKRGWTLQELIAPRHVVFFDRHWADIGTKLSLRWKISTITGVPVKLLAGLPDAPLDSFCIAQRLSWAAKRKTTREEDIAYCLMGIFDVNMPILYGEGKRAFIRLQEEILKRSDDETLFAWVKPSVPCSIPREYDELLDGHVLHPSKLNAQMRLTTQTSVFAPSPTYFKYGQFMKRIEDTDSQASPFSVTNKGLRITLPLVQTNEDVDIRLCGAELSDNLNSRAFLGILACKIVEEETPLAIILVRQPSGRYIRVSPDYLCRASRGLGPNGRKWLGIPRRTELYISTSILHSSSSFPDIIRVRDLSVGLSIINCTVMKCGAARYYLVNRDSVFLFALTIKNRGTGLGDAMVILSQVNGGDRISCWLYQPTHSAPFPQTLLEWLTKHEDQLQQNTLYSIGTDRVSLQFPSGDKIAASVNIGANWRYTVVIQWTDQQAAHPRSRLLHVVSEQDQRAYGETQEMYKTVWRVPQGRDVWTIFSRDVYCLPANKKHSLGDIEQISTCA